MSDNKTKDSLPNIMVRAINVDTNEIICEGQDGKKVINEANETGKKYILDFETEPSYNFLF